MTRHPLPFSAPGGRSQRPPFLLQVLLTFTKNPFEGLRLFGGGMRRSSFVGWDRIQTPARGPYLAPHPIILVLAHRAVLRNREAVRPSELVAPHQTPGHPEEPVLSPGVSDPGKRSCFQQCAQRVGPRAGVAGRLCPNAAPRTHSSAPNPARGCVDSYGLGLPGEGSPRGKGLQAGPAAIEAGLPGCAPAPTLLREDLTLPNPHDFRSSIMDPGEFLPGLKGITQIAETWLSGSGRNLTSNRKRNFSLSGRCDSVGWSVLPYTETFHKLNFLDFTESVLEISISGFHGDSTVLEFARRERIA